MKALLAAIAGGILMVIVGIGLVIAAVYVGDIFTPDAVLGGFIILVLFVGGAVTGVSVYRGEADDCS